MGDRSRHVTSTQCTCLPEGRWGGGGIIAEEKGTAYPHQGGSEEGGEEIMDRMQGDDER